MGLALAAAIDTLPSEVLAMVHAHDESQRVGSRSSRRGGFADRTEVTLI